MKASELIEQLEEYEDFEVEFVFTYGADRFLNVRSFQNLNICDIGYSDKVILLTGEEEEVERKQIEADDMVTAVKMIRSACRGKDCYDCPLWNLFHGCTLRDGAPDTWELPEERE